MAPLGSLFDNDVQTDSPLKFVIYIIILVVVGALVLGGIRLINKSGEEGAPSGNSDTTSNTSPSTASGNATKTTAKTTSSKGVASKAGITVPVSYDVVINYTDQGFVPGTIQIKAGQSVRFINKSGGTMRVASVQNPGTRETNTQFSQSNSVGKGGFYDFTFSERGTWLYENLNDSRRTGVVVVN